MAPNASTSDHPDVSGPDRGWSIERPAADIPDEARSLPGDALLLVVTDDGRSEWSERTRRAAIDLAQAIGARILFYDRSAESRFADGYASGPMTADTDSSHGERMLEPAELHYLGRDYLARDIAEAAASGVRAWAWLPKGAGQGALIEATTRFGCDLVVVPAELRERLTGRHGPFWRREPTLSVPVLVSGADGSLLDWQFATELSRVEFAVRQFGVIVIRGHFSDFEVRLDFDETKPETTRVEARVVAASLTTGFALRDRNLRGPTFFDVERHPYITFVSTAVTRSGDSYAIGGDLEIKGRRRGVELRGRFEGVGTARGYRRASMSATATIDRRDWDMQGGLMIANQVTLGIAAVAVRASCEPSAN